VGTLSGCVDGLATFGDIVVRELKLLTKRSVNDVICSIVQAIRVIF
jgi:hypothetical protein